jgi:O-antigen/teichoic acid export membrane protein
MMLDRLFQGMGGEGSLARLAKNSLSFGVGNIIQRSLSLLLLPLFTRYLTPSDYGVLGVLSILSLLLGTFSMCGLTNGISRYIYYPEQEKTTLEAVVWSPFLFVVGLSALLLMPLGIFSGPLSTLLFGSAQYQVLVLLTLLTIFVNNLSSIGTSLLIFQERPAQVNVINIATVILSAIFSVTTIIYFKLGVLGLVLSTLCSASVLLLPILRVSVFRLRPHFSFAILKKQLSFSLPLVLAILFFVIIDSSDRYLLKVFLPLSEVGLYTVAYNIGMLLTVLVSGFANAWPPFYHKQNQNGEGQNVCDDILKIYMLALTPAVIAVTVLSPWLMRIFAAPQFFTAYPIIPLVALAYVLKGPYIIFLMGILVKCKSIWQLYLEAVAMIINLLGNLLLIPLIGKQAAALTTLASYALMAFGSYWMVMRLNPIPRFSHGFFFKILLLNFACVLLFAYSSGRNWNYPVTACIIAGLSFFVWGLLAKDARLSLGVLINKFGHPESAKLV